MQKIIGIIIPLYNEENSLLEVYSKLSSLSKKIKEYKLKIIFINDCSSDNSLKILKEIKKKDNKIEVINLKERAGEWVAFKIAINIFDFDYATYFPADLQIPCEIIEKFIRKIKRNKEIEATYALGVPHSKSKIDCFFSGLYWLWLFLRFRKFEINKKIDTFFINKKIVNLIRKSNEFHNIIPFEIFKLEKYSFIKFKKNPRLKSQSKYNTFSKIEMFIKTAILSINTHLLNYKKPKYETVN